MELRKKKFYPSRKARRRAERLERKKKHDLLESQKKILIESDTIEEAFESIKIQIRQYLKTVS